MKKAALAILLTLSLAGCASMPHPFASRPVPARPHVIHAAPAPVAPPVVELPPAPPAPPPTFSERFRGGLKRLKWTHEG